MMKKIILHFCLYQIIMIHSILIAEAKSPQWRKVGKTDVANVFIDMNNISKRNGKVQLWILEEYLKEQNLDKKKFNSATIYKVIDCKGSIVTNNYIMFYSGSMGHGDPIDSININNDPIPMIINTGGINDIIKNMICR